MDNKARQIQFVMSLALNHKEIQAIMLFTASIHK